MMKFLKSAINAGIQHLPDPFDTVLFIMLDYRHTFGHYPNLFFPKTFNEKVQVRKIFDRRSQISRWADKYAVRDYVREKIGEASLPTLFHVTCDPSDIPFDELPKKYVVKASHGSGWVHIVRDGASTDRQELIERCEKWMSTNYWHSTKEWAYRNITPRILVEEFLDPGTGADPYDYKFFVFDGKVKAIEVDVDRFTSHKRNLYDTNWNRMDLRLKFDNYDADITEPERLETMIEYAQTLSDGIDFVRVDLYGVRDNVYFGELTTTPMNGFGKFTPSSWDKAFGDFWKMQMR